MPPMLKEALEEVVRGVYPEVARSLCARYDSSPCVDRGQETVAIDCRNLCLNKELSAPLQTKGNGGHSLNYQNPICYCIDQHQQDNRFNLLPQDSPSPTLNAHMGTGGNNTPMIMMCLGATDAHASVTDGDVSPTLLARAGTGGGNEPIVLMENKDE